MHLEEKKLVPETGMHFILMHSPERFHSKLDFSVGQRVRVVLQGVISNFMTIHRSSSQ